jgi:hypothetical protein
MASSSDILRPRVLKPSLFLFIRNAHPLALFGFNNVKVGIFWIALTAR